MKQFWTTFQNQRKGTVVVVTPEGTPIVTVEAGKEAKICAHDPHFVFARFSRVTYLPNHRVAVDENKAWDKDSVWAGLHTIELLNKEKADQMIMIDGRWVTCLSGIPTLVSISAADPLIQHAGITWELTTRKYPRQDDPRYAEKVTKVERIKEPRSKKEMRAIAKEIAMAEEAALKKDLERRFPDLKASDSGQA